MPNTKHGAYLRKLRQAKKLSQRQLWIAAGVSDTVVRAAERLGRVTWRSALKLAPVLGVDPVALLPRK